MKIYIYESVCSADPENAGKRHAERNGIVSAGDSAVIQQHMQRPRTVEKPRYMKPVQRAESTRSREERNYSATAVRNGI